MAWLADGEKFLKIRFHVIYERDFKHGNDPNYDH